MNYYDAREMTDKDGKGIGKWRYTQSNKRSGTYAVGHCAEGCDGHDTAEEAREHYRQYLLETRVSKFENASDTQHKCQVEGCDEWTQTWVHIGSSHHFALCEKHQTPEIYEQVMPPVNQIWSTE